MDLDADHSTFSQNRKRRFTESGLLELLFDETVALAITQKLVSPHTRRLRPHITAKTTGREAVHQRVRRLGRTVGDRLSQRARKKIEELWGEAKCWHGFRRFRRRGLLQVREEAYLMGWLLNLKRLATLLPAPA